MNAIIKQSCPIKKLLIKVGIQCTLVERKKTAVLFSNIFQNQSDDQILPGAIGKLKIMNYHISGCCFVYVLEKNLF